MLDLKKTMAAFSVKFYEMITDYLHPNLQHFIDRYTENGIVRLPLDAVYKIKMVAKN